MYAQTILSEIVVELFGPENLTQQKKRELLKQDIPHRTKIILDAAGNPHSIIQLASTDYLTFQLISQK